MELKGNVKGFEKVLVECGCTHCVISEAVHLSGAKVLEGAVCRLGYLEIDIERDGLEGVFVVEIPLLDCAEGIDESLVSKVEAGRVVGLNYRLYILVEIVFKGLDAWILHESTLH